jgi:hypothetical protein
MANTPYPCDSLSPASANELSQRLHGCWRLGLHHRGGCTPARWSVFSWLADTNEWIVRRPGRRSPTEEPRNHSLQCS